MKKFLLFFASFALVISLAGCGGIPDVAGTYVGTATKVGATANQPFAGKTPGMEGDISPYQVDITQNEGSIQCTHTFTDSSMVYKMSGTINEDGAITTSGTTTNWTTWNTSESGNITNGTYTSRITYVASHGTYIYDLALTKQ